MQHSTAGSNVQRKNSFPVELITGDLPCYLLQCTMIHCKLTQNMRYDELFKHKVDLILVLILIRSLYTNYRCVLVVFVTSELNVDLFNRHF